MKRLWFLPALALSAFAAALLLLRLRRQRTPDAVPPRKESPYEA